MSYKMEEKQTILHELYVFSEWKPEPEYLQKSDNILPENLSALWCWLKFLGPKKSLLDSITSYKERQHKWHMSLGDEGKVIAILTDNILEIRTKRSEYATIAARTTVSRDAYAQWRKVVWSPDCSFVAVAYGNGIVSFFDLTASNLFNIPVDCSRPGGLECTDNTHAVADIIFMPLRVKDNKWNWEVLIVTYDGKLRGYLISQMDGFKLHHAFRFAGGVGAVAYSAAHSLLYVAGLPRGSCKDPSSPLWAGITAWRILSDEPFYKLSVVSDQLETELAAHSLRAYVPLLFNKNMTFITKMVISGDGGKAVCLHCNGDVSVWRLPLLRQAGRWPLAAQPHHDMRNPLARAGHSAAAVSYHPVDVNWWSNEEIILSRSSGAVSVCELEDLTNLLGARPEFLQGSPQVTRAHHGTFMALECESDVLPARRAASDDTMETVEAPDGGGGEAERGGVYSWSVELCKSVLYAITDMETFQPRPRRVTVISRVYRLLGVRSVTPSELFNRKIESGKYSEALTLAERFHLDSDLVYQQQWRKTPVSTHAIHNYLSKVSKKVWAVHQCVDRLPETAAAARDLLHFGLTLTEQEILREINKDRSDEARVDDPERITLEHLNAYSSELLRCRHVMLFYRERLNLYEAILRCEKSSYVKEEYECLRCNSIVHSATELAKEGRVAALTCLWPHLPGAGMRLAVLERLPESLDPCEYRELLASLVDETSPTLGADRDLDWCRNEIFRSIWNSNWSEDTSSPECERATELTVSPEELARWYKKRARDIEERSGLVSHALTLLTLASQVHGVPGLETAVYHLTTLATLVYDIGVEGVTLEMVEKMEPLETCHYLMSMTSPATFVSDLKKYLIPYLKRHEILTQQAEACVHGLIEYLQSASFDDLSWILLVLQSPNEFELDVRTHLELAERCLMTHNNTNQLDMACDLLATILKESDGSIAPSTLLKRLHELERVLHACGIVWCRGVDAPLYELSEQQWTPDKAKHTLKRVARSLAVKDEKPTKDDWEKLLKDMLDLQSTLFSCVSKEDCYEIYASSLLTSGDAPSIKLASEVLTTDEDESRRGNLHLVPYERSVTLISNAAREYFNSASSLTDPALELAKCCLSLIKDGGKGIQEELDLIEALKILSAFSLTILPIQVRLCEDRMTLIEDCLKLDPAAYLASHKLLKLAKLLRIAGDDEQKREGQVLQLVGEEAMRAGPGGGGAAADAARRLAALRYKPAAALLAHVATHAQAHADRNTRRELFAASVTHCSPAAIEEILRSRLSLELEGLQATGASLREHARLAGRQHSGDDEFADAITTPVIEKRDLVAPAPTSSSDKKPLFNYLLDTLHNRFTGSDTKSSSTTESTDKSIHCQEFYRTLYPEHKVSPHYYTYTKFSIPDCVVDTRCVSQQVLKWYYIQNTLEGDSTPVDLECQVIQKCAEESMYADTPYSVSCLLRSTQDTDSTRSLVDSVSAGGAVSAVLYATLIKCNTPELRDNVYLTRPLQMARTTLKQKNASTDQLELIRACLDKLMSMVEINKLNQFGLSVNGPLFAADEDYRREVLYRMARSPDVQHVQFACSLADKYGMCASELWAQRVGACVRDVTAMRQLADILPPSTDKMALANRLKEEVFDTISGTDHNSLINYFTFLKCLDERSLVAGLTPAEHVKLLKKVKACHELDYKLLLSEPSASSLSAHIVHVATPESVALLSKLARSLPPALRAPPLAATDIYTDWLTKYFFTCCLLLYTGKERRTPESVALLSKLARSLPPALRAPPLAATDIYTDWLTKYFFTVSPASATTKKWMQQYRQCASYFNKLSKEDLLRFVTRTCFSRDAVQRVPSGTRSLMIMQAVDYCQQEQENDLKLNKIEMSWSQVGAELTRWARFLDNYHSTTIQGIVESNVPHDPAWTDIECSHGETERVRGALCRLVMTSELSPASLGTLLQCLHVDTHVEGILATALRDHATSLTETERLVSRVLHYHREGVKLSDALLESVSRRAAELGVPAHAQVALLALAPPPRQHDHGDDLPQVLRYTLQMLKDEWPDLEELTEDDVSSATGRRSTLLKLVAAADTWQRRRTLVDVLDCWPADRAPGERSVQCEYIAWLLSREDRRDSLVLIKMLLRRPLLVEEEIKWLSDNIQADAVINIVWIILLSKCEHSRELIPTLVQKYKESVLKQEIEDDLITALLESGLFTKLVSTPLYSCIVTYILSRESAGGHSADVHTVTWATDQLLKANFIAEAGHLKLLALGVPAPLRAFSQSVLYYKKMFSDKN